jgi:hypothetical protein
MQIATLLMVSGGCSGPPGGETPSPSVHDTEDKAIAVVKKLGGIVVFDEKLPDKPVIEVQLKRMCGIDGEEGELKELATVEKLTSIKTQVPTRTVASGRDRGSR